MNFMEKMLNTKNKVLVVFIVWRDSIKHCQAANIITYNVLCTLMSDDNDIIWMCMEADIKVMLMHDAQSIHSMFLCLKYSS